MTYIYMAVLSMVLLFSGRYKASFTFGIIGVALLGINYWIFPIAPKAFTM